MRNFLQLLAILVILFFNPTFAQKSRSVNHAFHNAFVFGLDGGITMPQSDYEKSKLGYSARLSGEYFFKTNSIHLLGLKLRVGSEEVRGEDSRDTISSQDGRRRIPPAFVTSIFSVGVAATYSISVANVFFPYVSGGFTNMWFDPKDDAEKPAFGNRTELYSKSTYAYNAEIGFKVLVSDNISINLSYNAYIPSTDYLDDVAAAFSKDAYSSALIGFSYSPFVQFDSDNDGVADTKDVCPDTPPGIKVDEFGCPVDSDKDGVPDYLDECLNTSLGTIVDSRGCPLDSDKDGVADSDDKCPGTPAGVEVDKSGCPVDSDKDGIADYLDECPDTPLNTTVDSKGCPLQRFGEVEIIQNGYLLVADDIFSPNSSKIKIEGKKYLDEIMAILQKTPNKKWRIEGHMDSGGDTRFLRTLSLERAKAILEYFTYFGGLKRENFKVFGLGDKSPIADNKTEEGRKRNRRIEIIAEE